MYSIEEFFKDAKEVDPTDAANQPQNREEFINYCEKVDLKWARDLSQLSHQIVGAEVYDNRRIN